MNSKKKDKKGNLRDRKNKKGENIVSLINSSKKSEDSERTVSLELNEDEIVIEEGQTKSKSKISDISQKRKSNKKQIIIDEEEIEEEKKIDNNLVKISKDFQKELLGMMVCGYCNCIYDNPHYLNSCKHVFCFGCILKSIEEQNKENENNIIEYKCLNKECKIKYKISDIAKYKRLDSFMNEIFEEKKNADEEELKYFQNFIDKCEKEYERDRIYISIELKPLRNDNPYLRLPSINENYLNISLKKETYKEYNLIEMIIGFIYRQLIRNKNLKKKDLKKEDIEIYGNINLTNCINIQNILEILNIEKIEEGKIFYYTLKNK